MAFQKVVTRAAKLVGLMVACLVEMKVGWMAQKKVDCSVDCWVARMVSKWVVAWAAS